MAIIKKEIKNKPKPWLWFVGLYCLSVLAFAAVTGLLHLLILPLP